MKPPSNKNMRPAEIAREAFRQLALRHITPTPEAYREIYNEVAGITDPYSSEIVLTNFANLLKKSTGELTKLSEKVLSANSEKDWGEYNRLISEIVDRYLLKKPDATLTRSPTSTLTVSPNKAYESLEAQISLMREMLYKALRNGFLGKAEIVKEAKSLAEGIKDAKTETKLFELLARIKQLCYKVGMLEEEKNSHSSDKYSTQVTSSSVATEVNNAETSVLHDMLFRVLNTGLPATLHNFKDLAAEAMNLAKLSKEASSQISLNDIAAKVKQLCYKINIVVNSSAPPDTSVIATNAPIEKGSESDLNELATQKETVELLRGMLLQLHTSVTKIIDRSVDVNESDEFRKIIMNSSLEQLKIKDDQFNAFCKNLENALLESKNNKNKLTIIPTTENNIVNLSEDAIFRNMFIRILNGGLVHFLGDFPDLMEEINKLVLQVQDNEVKDINELDTHIKQLCFTVAMKSEEKQDQFALLLQLFKLLIKNISELVDDNSWLKGQIESLQQLLDGPMDTPHLEETMRSLKELIYKQAVLKHAQTDAKTSVKNMIVTFIERLDILVDSTDEYHSKISAYEQEISKTHDPRALKKILEKLLEETTVAKNEAMKSREEILHTKQFVAEAEDRIAALQSQLAQMSELVMEDSLTGSLNRRGIDDVFEREIARSNRKKTELCIALLDLDDFKKINDTYGHVVGDQALVHLVRLIKETLRAVDIIGRFGGEEFLILLPDTQIEHAVNVITRLQRDLTKNIFMYNNQGLLITFSAGIAQRKDHNEHQTDLIKRADAALYKAKAAGKNRVIVAD